MNLLQIALVRRWISPSAGLKGLPGTRCGLPRARQKMDKPECGIESVLYQL